MLTLTRFDQDATAQDVRAIVAAPDGVAHEVAEIIASVRAGGDEAVRELTRRFDGADLGSDGLRVSEEELEAAIGTLDPGLLSSMRAAIQNVRRVATAQLGAKVAVDLPAGQHVDVREFGVRRAGCYVPGGRAPYPSTVIMSCVTARVAGVDQLCVCAPPGPDCVIDPVVLAACRLCDVGEVYRIGGAQALAALAYGTETVRAVDVVAGPGNAYVQEAKRQLSATVGFDCIAGPTELCVLCSTGADAELVAWDLAAQAEHGPDSLVCAISDDPKLLEAVASHAVEISGSWETVADGPLALVSVSDLQAGVKLADEIAPEHLELVGDQASTLAGQIRSAGCVFVGSLGATALGDYVAGTNHVLPTQGAARFASALSVQTFRRRMPVVSFTEESVRRLAEPGATLARSEGFPVHGESMLRRL